MPDETTTAPTIGAPQAIELDEIRERAFQRAKMYLLANGLSDPSQLPAEYTDPARLLKVIADQAAWLAAATDLLTRLRDGSPLHLSTFPDIPYMAEVWMWLAGVGPADGLIASQAKVDAQAERLAAAEQFWRLGAHTGACQAGLGYGGCEETCARLRTVIAGAAGEVA